MLSDPEGLFDGIGRPKENIAVDYLRPGYTFTLTKEVIEGNRPELTHLLDGDPGT